MANCAFTYLILIYYYENNIIRRPLSIHFGMGSMQTALAQDLQEMEKSLSAINEELNQKTKEYSW